MIGLNGCWTQELLLAITISLRCVCVQNVRNGEDGLLQDQKSFVKTLHAKDRSLTMKKLHLYMLLPVLHTANLLLI